MPPKPRGRPPKERSMEELEEILMKEGLKEARRVDRERRRIEAAIADEQASRAGTTHQETERLAFFKSPSILPALTSLTDQINQPNAGAAIMDATFDAAVKDRVRKSKHMSLLQPKRDINARISGIQNPELTGKMPKDRGLFLGGVDRPVRDGRVLPLTTKVGETHSMYEKVKMMSLFPNIYSM